MAEILFIYNQKEILIKCIKDEKMKDIISRFINLAQTTVEGKNFLYNGENIVYKQDLSFSEIINSFDRPNNRMIVLVYDGIFNDNNCKINNNPKKEDNYSILLNKINSLENRINKIENEKKAESNEKMSISLKYKEIEQNYLNLINKIKKI